MLPVAYPITFGNFNYAPITVVVAVTVVSLAWYLPKHGAKHAFLANRRGDYDSGSDKVRPRSFQIRHLCTGHFNTDCNCGLARVVLVEAWHQARLPGKSRGQL